MTGISKNPEPRQQMVGFCSSVLDLSLDLNHIVL